jgi:hypothetical protein
MSLMILLATFFVASGSETVWQRNDFLKNESRVMYVVTQHDPKSLNLDKINGQIKALWSAKIANFLWDQWYAEHFAKVPEEHLCSESNSDCQQGIELASDCIWKGWIYRYALHLDINDPQFQLFLKSRKREARWQMYKRCWRNKSEEEWERYHQKKTPQGMAQESDKKRALSILLRCRERTGKCLDSNEIGTREVGDVVNIVDIETVGKRVRGKIENGGWITLENLSMCWKSAQILGSENCCWKNAKEFTPSSEFNIPEKYKQLGTNFENGFILNDLSTSAIDRNEEEFSRSSEDFKALSSDEMLLSSIVQQPFEKCESNTTKSQVEESIEFVKFEGILTVASDHAKSSLIVQEPIENYDSSKDNDTRFFAELQKINQEKINPLDEIDFEIAEKISNMSKSKLREELKFLKWNTSGDFNALRKKLIKAMKLAENLQSEPVGLDLGKYSEQKNYKEDQKNDELDEQIEEENSTKLTKKQLQVKLSDRGINFRKNMSTLQLQNRLKHK